MRRGSALEGRQVVGGWYGGGTGGFAGGGGGSSYVDATGNENTDTTAGVRSGHGTVTITW